MFDLYASRLSAAADIVRRVGKAIEGTGIEAGEDPDNHAIALTGQSSVLQPMIDAGYLERMQLDGDDFDD